MNVTKIKITEVSYLDDTATPPRWMPVSAYNPDDVGSTEHPLAGESAEEIIAYSSITGFPVGGKSIVDLDWSQFRIEGETGSFGIFGSKDNQIPITVKSPLIRFKLKTVVNTEPVTETANPGFNYVILKASFSEDPFDGLGGTAAVSDTSATVAVEFMFPGFDASDVSTVAAEALKQLLSTPGNWEMANSCVANSYLESRITPTEAEAVSYDPDATDYGLGAYKIRLKAHMNFPSTGNYTVQVKFKSNNQAQQFNVVGYQEISATVTQYMGSASLVLVYGAYRSAFSVEVASTTP